MFDFLQICLRKAKPVCKIPHMFILADVWLLPNMFGKNQTRWYIYTWVLFSTHVWILTHRYGKRHTCVQKATQLYVCKCLAFSTHVWEKPLTCLFPPELSVAHIEHCEIIALLTQRSCPFFLISMCIRYYKNDKKLKLMWQGTLIWARFTSDSWDIWQHGWFRWHILKTFPIWFCNLRQTYHVLQKI